MKKILLTLTLLLSLGLSFSGVAAQTDSVEPIDLGSEMDVEGLESVYDRTFSVDIEALMASPEALESLDMSAMMRMVSIQGMTFDNEDHAKDYLKTMQSEVEKAMENEDLSSMGDVQITELEGFDADGLMMTMDMPDLGAAATIIVFIDGNQMFQIMAMDSDLESSTAFAEEVSTFVIEAETETDEVTFNADGTSTGGVFDRMPTADDEIVGDLTSVTDSEIFKTDE